MEFMYPYNTIFFIPAAAAALAFVLAFRKKGKIMAVLYLRYDERSKALRTALLGAGLSLMAFSLMGPQALAGYTNISKTGLDIYVLMDTSKSMLATDIAPDRMTLAKKITGDLLGNLKGDRIGFIPFASDAYIQMPLTDDYRLAKMFLDVMDTEMISGGGTNIAAAIRLAGDSFDRASGGDRVILIISDGEEQDGSGLEAIKKLADERFRVYAIGVGTERGGLVPVYGGSGDIVTDYLKDGSGNPVTSRLNAGILAAFARAGRGSYYQAGLQGEETVALLHDISVLKRNETAMEQKKRFTQLYQYFLAVGMVLTILALLPGRGKAS